MFQFVAYVAAGTEESSVLFSQNQRIITYFYIFRQIHKHSRFLYKYFQVNIFHCNPKLKRLMQNEFVGDNRKIEELPVKNKDWLSII